MDLDDYIFCRNYADGYIGGANKNMDHDRFNRLKTIFESLSPKDKKEILKNGNKRKNSG